MTPPSLTRSLTRLIRERDASPANLLEASRFVQDWVGSYVAGWTTGPAGPLLAYGEDRTDLEGRVFLASALSHISETDDLHRRSVTHPACVVIPVALLLGSHRGVDGPGVLRAVLAGYEAMIRVGNAVGGLHYRTFHTTATAGVFGAAAAAASLLELDEDAWVWALGNAGTQAGGLWEFLSEGAMSKHLHAGAAASAGLRAALLAAQGFTGPEKILEGERGFFRGFCPDAEPGRVMEAGEGWALQQTSLKPWPCCRHTHPAIDAALQIRDRLKDDGVVDGLAGATVEVSTYATALRVTDDPTPGTPYAARFSLQFCVAAALLHGPPDSGTFQDRLHDPELRTLMGRVRVGVDPVLEAAYPSRWGADVAVTEARGGVVRVVSPDAKGDPENPLSDRELRVKLRGLFHQGRLAVGNGEELLDALHGMAHGGPIPALPTPGAGGTPPSGVGAAIPNAAAG